MLQEKDSLELETNHILPNIYVSCETCVTSKEISASISNEAHEEKNIEPKCLKEEEVEIAPDAHIPEQMTSSQPQLVITSNNTSYAKAADVPHVLQACQNFDLRFQRELLKSAFSLNLNSDGCLNQTTGDEDAAFRLACAKYMRNYQQNYRQQSHESEEQAAIRRARNALRMRNYRQNLQEIETTEQAAERRAQNALRMRNYRRFKREIQPELAAERRAQNAERMRNYRKVIRELKPETAALLRAQNALRMRNYRKNKLQKEPE